MATKSFKPNIYTKLPIEVLVGTTVTTDTNEATFYTADNHVGYLYFAYVCLNNGNELVRVHLPDGWDVYDQIGVVIRDIQNGNLITCWANHQIFDSVNYAVLSTYLHTGTMTAGHTYKCAIPVIKN